MQADNSKQPKRRSMYRYMFLAIVFGPLLYNIWTSDLTRRIWLNDPVAKAFYPTIWLNNHDLYDTMIQDESGRIKNHLAEFMREKDVNKRWPIFEEILFAWANTGERNPGWEHMDSRQVEFFYKMHLPGCKPPRTFPETGPSLRDAAIYKRMFYSETRWKFDDLNSQTHYAYLYKSKNFDQLILLLRNTHATRKPLDRANLQDYLLSVSRENTVSRFREAYWRHLQLYNPDPETQTFEQMMAASGYAYFTDSEDVKTGGWYDDILVGDDGDDIMGLNGSSVYWGGRGDDFMKGLRRGSFFAWGKDDGRDIVYAEHGWSYRLWEKSSLWLLDCRPDEIDLTFDGGKLVITAMGSNGSLTVLPSHDGKNEYRLGNGYGIGYITYGDRSYRQTWNAALATRGLADEVEDIHAEIRFPTMPVKRIGKGGLMVDEVKRTVTRDVDAVKPGQWLLYWLPQRRCYEKHTLVKMIGDSIMLGKIELLTPDGEVFDVEEFVFPTRNAAYILARFLDVGKRESMRFGDADIEVLPVRCSWNTDRVEAVHLWDGLPFGGVVKEIRSRKTYRELVGYGDDGESHFVSSQASEQAPVTP